MLKNIFKNWLKNCVIFSIFFCFFVSAHAAENVCQTYSIPLAPVPCDAGYTGKKFPMRTKTCPDGKITDGLTFDYSNCKPAGRENVDLNATDCSITPTAVGCMPVPTLSGCPSGKHWSLAGSNIAHCVNNDPVCPWGTSLTHDFLGEPSCIANTCPSNQVLQSDGISCACPASLPVWNGSSCVVPVCNSYISNANAYCPAGQTGYITNQNTYDCNNNLLSTVEIANTCVTPVSCPGPTTQYTACPVGQTGQRVVTTNYTLVNGACSSSVTTDSSGCSTPAVTQPPASCTPVNFNQNGPCPAGQTGTATRTATQNCDGTTTYGPWNTSGCTPNCQSATTTETAACEPGYSGTRTRAVTTNSCTGTSYGDWDRSLCMPDPKKVQPNVSQCPDYSKVPNRGDIGAGVPYNGLCMFYMPFTDVAGTNERPYYDAAISQGFICTPFQPIYTPNSGSGWEISWGCIPR